MFPRGNIPDIINIECASKWYDEHFGGHIKTSSAKGKGRRLQDAVRDAIRKLTGLGEGDVDSQIMGVNGADIRLSPKAKELFPYSVECKNTEKVSLWNFWDQALSNKGELTPLLFIKKNRRTPLVVLDAEYFFKLLEEKNKDGRE